MALQSSSIATAFGLGLTTGVLYFAGTLYWITHVMVVYGGLTPWVSVLVNMALVSYLALYPAFFAVMLRQITLRLGPRFLLAAPIVWVATELGRTHLFTGFPWVLVGYSQVTVPPVAQLASLLGVYGVSALVVTVSAAAAAALVQSAAVTVAEHHREGAGVVRAMSRAFPYRSLLAAIVLAVGVSAWGAVRVERGDLTREGDPVRVGIVQGNVDQADKWNTARAEEIFRRHLRLTEQAVAEGAELVLWPESSTPFFFMEDRPRGEEVRQLARETGVSILLGSDEIERGTPDRYYNSAFLVRHDGQDGGVYRKMHLVPFGEYVPLKPVFFFAAPLIEAVSDFSAGDRPVLLSVDGRQIGTAICYEVVYPDLVRRFVTGGSELLTTITNDAWFGATSAPYQHFAQAAMRAIENGRYLVRAANTGISGVVDPYGRTTAESRLFEPAVIVSDVRYLRDQTLYSRTGDVFAHASTLATFAMLLAGRWSRRRM